MSAKLPPEKCFVSTIAIGGHLYSIGQPIGIEDIMIASIALGNGLTVVSANIKHFFRVPDLKSENWFQ